MMYALLYSSPEDPDFHEDLVAVSERVDLLKRHTVQEVANQHQITVAELIEKLGDPDAELVWGMDELSDTLSCEFPREWDAAFDIRPVTVL